MSDMTDDNVTDNDASRQRHESLLKDVSELLQKTQYRQFVWWLLQQCEIYATNFAVDGHSAFVDGKRHIGITLIALLQEVHPTAYADLLRENCQKDFSAHEAARRKSEENEA